MSAKLLKVPGTQISQESDSDISEEKTGRRVLININFTVAEWPRNFKENMRYMRQILSYAADWKPFLILKHW